MKAKKRKTISKKVNKGDLSNKQGIQKTGCCECCNFWMDSNGKPTQKAFDYFENIVNELDKRDARNSSLTSNYKSIIKICLSAVTIFLALLTITAAIMLYQGGSKKLIIVLLSSSLATVLAVLGIKGVDSLNKSDSYNLMMLFITLLSLVISLSSLK